MRSATAVLLLALTASSACGQATTRPERPSWVSALILKLEGEPVANPPASIARYVYRGDTVYYLPPRCCDIQSVVFDKVGKVMCAADGGMTGRGDGRCPDFFETRREETIVWRDSRGGA
mgnify:FL=1